MSRPNWDDYLLGLAKVVARRSHDTQTQHGCVIVDSRHRILSTGCNGFPAGMKDSVLPTTRPEKYDWMIHSEENAVLNANASLEGSTAYVTGSCCLHCLLIMKQKGVGRIVQIDARGWSKDAEQVTNKKIFEVQANIRMECVSPDLSWLVDMILDDSELCEIAKSRLK